MLVPVFQQPPALNWRWRTAREGEVDPHAMATTHLFHTLRMIWNNTMPAHMHTGKVRLYRFGPRHSTAYLREAVVQIGRELFRRDDLPPHMRRQLEWMAKHFEHKALDKA